MEYNGAQTIARLRFATYDPARTRTHYGRKIARAHLREAGVDIDAGNRMVELIKPLVRATARPGADAEIGGFWRTVRPDAVGYRTRFWWPPPMASAPNSRLRSRPASMTRSASISVAMTVNDLVVQGRRAAFLSRLLCLLETRTRDPARR